jgi:hypothetical protein
MARHPHRYEVWDSTPTRADIVGHTDSLLAALMLYRRTRKTAPGHTIDLLVDKPTRRRWVRTVHVALGSLATSFAVIALIRYQQSMDPNPLSLPVPAIAFIAMACAGLAAVLAAVGEQRRNRNRLALQTTSTPAESSQAISAMWRGPVPDNPRVRYAAGQLAWLQLSTYRKNRLAYWVSYPLLVLIWLWSAIDNWVDHESDRAIVSAILAGGFLVMSAWLWLARRRLKARIALLAPTLISHPGHASPEMALR